jgi:hypothetical protein
MTSRDAHPVQPHLLAAAGAGVVINRLLIRAGVRRRVDGWRRAAGLVLRGEASTFVLSAFGLDLWSDVPGRRSPVLQESEAHVAERLAKFLLAEVESHIRVRMSPLEDRAEGCQGPSYTLGFEPWAEGPRRFCHPETWRSDETRAVGRADGCGELFNIIARIGPDGACDLWLRVNHVGIDGVPAQELLTGLEEAWGSRKPVLYPTPEEFGPLAVPRPWPGRAGLAQVQSFLDFGRLLAWRKRENTRLREPMTVAAAIQWRLARQPSFESLYFGSTVEVAPVGGLNKGVGVVVVRPAAYLGRPNGLAQFARDFNRQVELNRARASAGCKALDAAAHLSPRLAAALLRHALEHSPKAFGSIALTVLRDAKVFGAPIAQFGHDHGFLALGSVTLPARDGRAVGCITVKGPAAVIAGYPEKLRAAIETD